MKKTTVILISAVSILFFAALVWWGLTRSRGVPVIEEELAKPVVEVLYVDKDIDFKGGVSIDEFRDIPATEIELMYQVMVFPWGKSRVSPLTVKAFHNNKDIYVYFKWADTTENRKHEKNTFSDACAIMFPMDDNAQPSTLMMGFLGAANIWQWKGVQDREFWMNEPPTTDAYSDFYYPFEEEELFVVSKDLPVSAVNDLMAVRVATITPKDKQIVEGRGVWKRGSWHVILRRQLAHEDDTIDVVFTRGEKRLCAFAVWEGESGDRGGRKSISNWVELDIK